MSHTPGPWEADDRTVIASGLSGNARIVAEACGTIRTADVARANAHLIAAAPDLLAALGEANEWNDSDIHGFEEITPTLEMLEARPEVLRVAIAKAAGGA